MWFPEQILLSGTCVVQRLQNFFNGLNDGSHGNILCPAHNIQVIIHAKLQDIGTLWACHTIVLAQELCNLQFQTQLEPLHDHAHKI